ncbi:cytochrome P450 [Galbibacter pacificus]|uniref:Cytochrome P450 n=1 Tax=Galbibacter pacificus TaxID=2996052 RepID=A0ABT6FNB5_9FLAO|nr:cytochrome P450 [Galbibacter pacificus]MDG3581282.1 cytochrome P450 [Galbibacter pacificus]MDG3584760.1 cytochrome P450 [Galbibacter pacificus]
MSENRNANKSHKAFVYINDIKTAMEISMDNHFGPPRMKQHLLEIDAQSNLDLSTLILIVENALFFMSGERHAILKQRILRIIGPAKKRKWDYIIEEAISESISNLSATKQIDLIADFTYPIYRNATQRLLGISPENPQIFEYWVPKLQELLEPLLPLRTLGKMEEAFKSLLQEVKRNRNTNTDMKKNEFIPLIDDLIKNPIKNFTDDDYYAVILVLYGASLNISQTLGNILFQLLKAPEEIKKMASNPKWVNRNLERLIKSAGSAPYVHRVSSDDARYGDYKIKKNDNVLLDLPQIHTGGCPFQQLDWGEEKIGRNDHLAFGRGIHYCVGAGFARHLMERAIVMLFVEYPDLVIVEQTLDIVENNPIVALNSLKCKLNE